MSKVAFVQTAYREQFGFMYLSAMLKRAGHETDVFIIENEMLLGLITEKLKGFDIIGFSSSTIDFKINLDYARYIKKRLPGSFIIFGGPHATFYSEEVIKNDCINAICIGEGYEAIVEIANKIQEDKHPIRINNIWIKVGSNLIKNPTRPKYDINKLPMPDYELYYDKYPKLKNKKTKQVYIVHGCPYKCTFCWNGLYNKMYSEKTIQCMNVEKAIKEIKYLKDTYGFTWLQFISDNMTVNKKWLKKFMKAYRENIVMAEKTELLLLYEYVMSFNRRKPINLSVPFLMNCRANEVTKEIVDTLKESGCNRVDFGVEHGNDYIRNKILKRNMSKQQIINCGKWLNEAGIRVQTTNIFGVPQEDFNKAWESVELNRKFTPEISKACILQPFPNTEIYNYAKENNYLKGVEYSGTTYQIGVKDIRSTESKVYIENEKQIIRLSYLFDFFVKQKWIPRIIGKIICVLPLDKLYKKYYAYVFKKQVKKYG
jgi:radical SAM superfamily enzyme YgiQ (UPF0313 family)